MTYRKTISLVTIIIGFIAIMISLYIILNVFLAKSSSVSFLNKSAIDLNTQDDATDYRNRIQIKKIGIEVPIYDGDESVLEKGVWHRIPKNGNPYMGGNFILAAHRFELGITPNQTKQKSPFYNLDKLNLGDEIKVFFNNKWYKYEVTKKYTVAPNAFYIENKSDQPKLTLYSCTLKGASDGRDVIEATPLN